MQVVSIPKCIDYNGTKCLPYFQKRGRMGHVTNFLNKKITVLVINDAKHYY